MWGKSGRAKNRKREKKIAGVKGKAGRFMGGK